MTIIQLNVPIGTILDYAGNEIPLGYLECDGRAISRSQYPKLFAILNTTWGAGDGSTTFNLPNLGGKTCIGEGTRNVGDAGGSENESYTPAGSADSHILTTSEIPSHSHTLTKSGGVTNYTGSKTSDAPSDNTTAGPSNNTSGTGTNHTHTLSNHTHTLSSHTHTLSSHTHTTNIGHGHGFTQPRIHRAQNAASGTARYAAQGTDNNVYLTAYNGAVTDYTGSKTSGGPSNNTSGTPSNNTSGTPSNNTSGGESSHTHTLSSHTHTMKNHTHTTDIGHGHGDNISFSAGNTGDGDGHSHGFTGTQATISHMQPYAVVKKIIRVA